MKTQMQDTSLQAYTRLQPRLAKTQQKVLTLLQAATAAGMDMTDTEIANALHWKINCVTGRRNELAKAGLIAKSTRRWNSDTRCYNWSWRAKP